MPVEIKKMRSVERKSANRGIVQLGGTKGKEKGAMSLMINRAFENLITGTPGRKRKESGITSARTEKETWQQGARKKKKNGCGLKMKWKEENDRMGRMLEEAKKKREAKLQAEKEEREAERKREMQLREAEKKRQEEMALAVKKAKERREAEKEMERRAQQAKDEGIQMRRRLVEQQRRNRLAVQTSAVQSSNAVKDENPRKPLTQPVEDKRKMFLRRDKPSRNEAWSTKQDEPDDSQGSRKGTKGVVVKSIFPSRHSRARTPSPPPSPAAIQARRNNDIKSNMYDDSEVVLSTRDQVLART